jgi:hypothetical protein
MTTQPKALRLAAAICDYNRYRNESEQVAKLRRMKADTEAAAALRQLHESNKDLLEALKDMNARYGLTDLARAAIAKAEGEQT